MLIPIIQARCEEDGEHRCEDAYLDGAEAWMRESLVEERLPVRGVGQVKLDPRRLVIWLDIGPNLHTKNTDLIHMQPIIMSISGNVGYILGD